MSGNADLLLEITQLRWRVSHLEAVLCECSAYFGDRADINNHGGPNEEMRLGMLVDETLEGKEP